MSTLVDGRASTLMMDGDVYEDILSISLEGADKGQLSFTDIQTGATKDFTMTVNVKVDLTTTGLWRAAHDAAASNASVDLIWAPFGNATATAGQPHIVASNATLDGVPALKVDANQKDKAVADVVFNIPGTYTVVYS
jgi:hypothetical protein